MTINEIMLRDILEAERKRKAENEMAEYDRKVRKMLWRRRLKALGEIAGGIAFFALLAATAWLCCVASGYHWE